MKSLKAIQRHNIESKSDIPRDVVSLLTKGVVLLLSVGGLNLFWTSQDTTEEQERTRDHVRIS